MFTENRLKDRFVADNTMKDVDLADTPSSLTSLTAYPNVRQLYIQMNTGLPASAAVERLFSLGGRMFTPLRQDLVEYILR